MTFPETPASLRWRAMVQAERIQTERSREAAPEQDFWRRLAHRFTPKAPDDQPQDPAIAAVDRILGPSQTVLDVGAGGGRLAVPLARHRTQVIAVEPSESMRKQLGESVARHGIRNIQLIAATWLEAQAPVADAVLCAHVLYGVDDIEPFVDKLTSHARRLVAVVMQPRSPMSNFHPLWRLIHGEPRRALPSLPEFLEALQSWRISYDITRLAATDLNLFSDYDEAVDYSMQRLFLAPGTEKARRLQAALKEVLVETEGGLTFEWTRRFVPRVITWQPSHLY